MTIFYFSFFQIRPISNHVYDREVGPFGEVRDYFFLLSANEVGKIALDQTS